MLVRLKDKLDPYHQRRADKHGYLYIVSEREREWMLRLYEARSIATGVVCTFDAGYVEEVPDAP